MNKSLRFLAIGLALAVLLVSQVGVDRAAEAVLITEKNDTVEFAGPAGTDDAAEQQDFYMTNGTVDFYLKDPDLALPTSGRTAKVTFAVPTDGTVTDGVRITLKNIPAADEDGNTPGPIIGEDTATTTPEDPAPDGFGAGRDDPNDQGSTGITFTTNGKFWDDYMGNPSTPLDGRPVVTVRNARNSTENGERFVDTYDRETGRLTFLGGAVTGNNAVEEADNVSASATTTVEVSFKYHVADVFPANRNRGTSAGADENRARVTSSSDGVGRWVTIREVEKIGSQKPAPETNIYHGSIMLNSDSTAASRDSTDEEPQIGVRDGDTLRVVFYQDDHVTEVDDDTATIDGQKPTIVSISPSDKTVTDRSSPVITVRVSDDGSGFDTSESRGHVDISIEDGNDTCTIPVKDLTPTRLSSSEIDILYRNAGSWILSGSGIVCGPESTKVNHKVDSASLGVNSHGRQFTIRVVARDVAGNLETEEALVTIDTKAPGIDDGSTTGKNWDATKNEGMRQIDDSSAIKVVFNEGLDASTVDVSDFVVENPDASIESVQVGGDGDEKNEIVYLKLSADLASDARPRVELDGSIKDVAGNELKSLVVARAEDGIKPGVTVDAFSAQLLVKDGESAVTFSADENLSANTEAVANEQCTCLMITGGSGVDATRGDVILPNPSNGTYTFEARSITGIYGVLVQASDIRAQVTREGATKVTDEKTKAMDVSGGEVKLTPHDDDAEVEATTTVARFTVTVSLTKWPLADANFSKTLADDVSIKGADGVEGESIPGSKVTKIDWDEDGTVTLELTYSDEDTTLANDDELMATYYYVKAEQTVEVDLDPPAVAAEDGFSPSGNVESARPFIRINWDEDEYAGDTHKTVTITSATLTGPGDFEMVLVGDETDVLSTSDWVLYTYLPESELALGEYTITAIGRDEAGNVSEPQTGKFKVVARIPVTIPLNLGWNLMSLPAEPADSAIDTVINVAEVTQVLTYDPTVEGGWLAAVRVNGAFEGGLTNIDATKAYLVYTTSVDPLKVDLPGLAQGATEFPPAIQLHKGWNMVPASSLDPAFPKRDIDSYLSGVSWSRGYYYETDGSLKGFIPGKTPSDEEASDDLVVKGRGFLIYVTEDSTLVP